MASEPRGHDVPPVQAAGTHRYGHGFTAHRVATRGSKARLKQQRAILDLNLHTDVSTYKTRRRRNRRMKARIGQSNVPLIPPPLPTHQFDSPCLHIHSEKTLVHVFFFFFHLRLTSTLLRLTCLIISAVVWAVVWAVVLVRIPLAGDKIHGIAVADIFIGVSNAIVEVMLSRINLLYEGVHSRPLPRADALVDPDFNT